MGMMSRVLERREEVIRIVRQNDAERPRLFGSVARNEDGPGSDIDILVDAGPSCTLFSMAKMENELAELFDRRVDVRTLAGLHPSMRGSVLSQAVEL